MSRLYGTMTSDTRRKTITSTGNQAISATLLWQSPDGNDIAVRASVEWIKGSDLPILLITYDSRLDNVRIETE